MQFSITFKNIDSPPGLREYAEKKLTQCIEKFVRNPIEVQVVFSKGDRGLMRAHCNVFAGGTFDAVAEALAEDFFLCTDQLVDKLDQQLRRQKEKVTDHYGGVNPREEMLRMLNRETQNNEPPIDVEDVLEYERAPATTASTTPPTSNTGG